MCHNACDWSIFLHLKRGKESAHLTSGKFRQEVNMPGVVGVEHVGTQDIEIKSKKMSEAKKKIYAKNLKSTDACGKLVEQVIKAELWMSFVKKFK